MTSEAKLYLVQNNGHRSIVLFSDGSGKRILESTRQINTGEYTDSDRIMRASGYQNDVGGGSD